MFYVKMIFQIIICYAKYKMSAINDERSDSVSNLIQINNKQIIVKEFRGQRVVTFKDIDTVHERAEGTARKRFNDNKQHFMENVDYFFVKPVDVQMSEFRTSEINNSGTYLITESGYLILVKSFSDSLAWKVQRELVNGYFKVKEVNPYKHLSKELQSILILDKRTQEIESRIEHLENNMTIDYGQQLTLQELARFKAIQSMGGKGTPSYKNRSLRCKVFAQVWKDFKDYFQVSSYKNTSKKDMSRAVEYIKGWNAQGRLLREIEVVNSQVDMKEAI